MSFRPDKVNGIDMRSVHTTITENTSFANDSLPVGRDIVVLAGFFDGPHNLYDTIPVLSIDQVIRAVVSDLADTEAVKTFKQTSIYRALISCRLNGGSDVILFKLGSLSEWTSADSEDKRMCLLHLRLKDGIEFAVDNEWYAYVIPVDAMAEGYKLTTETTLTFPNSVPMYTPHGVVSSTNEDGTWNVTTSPQFFDFLSITALACAGAMSNGVFVQAMLSTASTNGTILVNSESVRGKEAWQSHYCYGQQVGWVPGNDAYRFVAVPTGRALFSSQDYGTSFEHGLAPAVAGLASSLPDDVSLAGRKLNVFDLRPVLGSTSDELSVTGFMPVGLTASMRRGNEVGAVILGDNTLAVPMSDFKQEVVLRLARRVSQRVRLAIDPLIGTNGQMVGSKVIATMDRLVQAGTIRAYKHEIQRDPSDPSRLRLYLEIVPFLPVKAIEINLVTGPFVL